MKKILSLLICLVLIISLATFSASAAGDFRWKELDKAYVSFLFDDRRMDDNFTENVFNIFQSYNMPMCCAVCVDNETNLIYDDTSRNLLLDIQKEGGEILSHCYDHKVIRKENSNVEYMEKELGQSYIILTKLGFNITGVIETGAAMENGIHPETTADYDLMRPIVKKYYKYSDRYGLTYDSSDYDRDKYQINNDDPYEINRIWMYYYDENGIKNFINDAIKNKQWITFSAHHFKEFTKGDGQRILNNVLNYIQMQGKDKVEVVTWRQMYEKFGEYTGPQIPSAEALAAVKAYTLPSSTTTPDATPSADNSATESAVSSTAAVSSLVASTTESGTSEIVSDNTVASKNETSEVQATDKKQDVKKGINPLIIAAIALGVLAIAITVTAVILVIKFKKKV